MSFNRKHSSPVVRSLGVRSLGILALLMFVSASAALAAGSGRMIGKVVDTDGQPIEGVSVTVTSPDLNSYNEVRTTKKNGQFTVSFSDAYLPYIYQLEKAGYQSIKQEYKAVRQGVSRFTFEMPVGVSAAEADAMQQVSSESNEAIMAFNNALAAFEAKDNTTAKTEIAAALTADPEIHQAHLLLAEILISEKQYLEAATSAEKALELAPGNVDGLRMRYEAYRSGGEKEKSEEAFAAYQAAGEAAEEAKRIYNEGVQLDKAGDVESAYAKFLQAAEMDPNLGLAQVAVMAAAYKSKRHDEAAAAAERILVNSPQDPQALKVRYDSYVGLKDDAKILDALVDLAAVDKDFASQTLYNSGIEKFNAGDYKAAVLLLGKTLKADASNAQAHYYLGISSLNMGDNATAKTHLGRFVELAPEDENAAAAKEMMNYLK
ncbi:MAG: tetratricopeptide repeat protein [Deltaproteobacteria bacterium]|nr:tetratricopeptide repeat protein [Deltaproteobacteria bacterium]